MRNDTLIISNHHRRAKFFEESMFRMVDHGYERIFVQDTGNEAWGRYQGPSEKYTNLGHHASYDQGMVNFRQHGLPQSDKILLVDNDCFIADPTVVDRYIEDFDKDGYDFSCHHISAKFYEGYEFGDSTIAEVKDQKFHPQQAYPGFFPEPHWENAYLLIRRSLWNDLSPQDIHHGMVWLKQMVARKAKLGAHIASFRSGWTHYGDGWFHIGNIMASHYKLEKPDGWKSFDPASEFDMARIGYFFTQPDIYPAMVNQNLKMLEPHKELALQRWGELTKGTCMETWNG